MRQEIVHWIMKKLNVRQSTITHDTLIIADVDSKVKRRVTKLLLEYSMGQFHNELIASPDDGGLLGSIHAEKNDVIISNTMLRSLTPPQLRSMIDNHKMMCGCAICNTSKYMQESLNAWWRKQLKIMKYKAENSRGRKKGELTQAYKSYADYAFTEKQTRHTRCKMHQIMFFVHQIMMNVDTPNWKFVLRKCTVCSSIALP